MTERDKSDYSVGIFFVLLPVFGYALAFGYECGYLNFFGIKDPTLNNNLFININLQSIILGTLSALILVLLITVLFIEPIYPYRKKIDHPIYKRILAILFIESFLLLIISNLHPRFYIVLIIEFLFLLFMIYMFFIRTLLKMKSGEMYLETLRELDRDSEAKRLANQRESFISYVFSKIKDYSLGGLLIIGLFLTIGSYAFGYLEARSNVQHLIVDVGSEEYLLIGSYNDQLLGVLYRPDTKSFNDNYILINQSDNIKIQNINTGLVKFKLN